MNTVLGMSANISNASLQVSNSFGNAGELLGVALLVAWVVVIMSVFAAARSSTYFQRLLDALSVVGTAIYYAIHGLATVTVAAVVLSPAYLLATADASTRSAVGRYVIYGAAVFALLAIIGYVSRHYFLEPAMENADEAGLLPDEDLDDEGEVSA